MELVLTCAREYVRAAVARKPASAHRGDGRALWRLMRAPLWPAEMKSKSALSTWPACRVYRDPDIIPARPITIDVQILSQAY
jgi:hypothetical protein